MNVIIMAIIALLVLIVLAVVFTGSIANTVDKMKTFLGFGTGGKTLEFAKEQCNTNCVIAKGLDNPKDSSYCTQVFNIKEDTGMKFYVCDTDNHNIEVIKSVESSTESKSVESSTERAFSNLMISCSGVQCE